jgi:hypothetical protein
MTGLRILDGFFFVFHTALIVFNLLGWVPRRTRRLNLLLLTLTGLSWFGLGIWYGWGYCPLTDWHWDVRRALGYRDGVASYNALLVYKFTGWAPPARLTDGVTVAAFFAAWAASLWVNLRRGRRTPGAGTL